MNTTPIKVCGYVRGSTEEQQNTLVAQEEQVRAYCTFKGLECVRVFVESGESGSTPFYERPVAAEAIAWMRAEGVKSIIFTKLDRGFRDALDCLFTVDNLGRAGIDIHILDIQLDTTSSVGKLVLTVMAAIAEFENKRRSERQKAAFKVMRAAGQRCGAVPYGWDDANGQLVPNDYEQATRERLLTGDLSTLSLAEAARRLNAEAVPAKNGGQWFGATIGKLRVTADKMKEAA